ncbi:RDD family protein [Microbacterium pumilum]|uniref:FHA domain-containing protein n=1 Tax=Microbacterium pumilum TaxID=344165 RepID=A0ABP5DDY0_9MICO
MNSARGSVAATPAMGRRVGTCAIDVAVGVAVPFMLVSMVSGAVIGFGEVSGATAAGLRSLLPVLLLLSWAGWALVHSAMQGSAGSIGQRMTGLRLADAETGDRIGFGRALSRNVVFHLAAAIVVGFFSPLFDRSARRQGWHDLAVRACCVDVRADRPSPVAAPPAASLAPAAPRAYGARVNTTVSADAPTGAVERIDAPELELTAVAGTPGRFPRTSAALRPVRDVDEARMAASGTLRDQPGQAGSGRAIVGHRVITVLTWDDGTRMAVYERTVCGRNPEREGGVAVRAVRDETLSVSKTHFEIGGDDGAWIIDRFSTNGTNLVRDGERIGLVPGLPAALRAGDRLEFGDRSAVVGGAA